VALTNAIVEAKSHCEFLFFQLRKSRRDLRSAIHSPTLIRDIDQCVRFLTEKKVFAQRSRLSSLVDRLCSDSIWCKFSCSDNVVNLSNYSLKLYETEILGYGLNFALPANRHHFPRFFRNLNFQNSSHQNDLLSSVFGSIYSDLASFSKSLPKRYLDALLSLKRNSSIKVCPADKGGKIVILNSCDYVNKLSVMFSDSSTYKPINSNPLIKMQSSFNLGLKNLVFKYPDSKSFILSFRSFLPSLPYAYGLPKVHKPDCPLRPIISSIGSPSYNLSKKLASILSPYLGSFSAAHLRHSGDLLAKLKNTTISSSDKLISFDAVSLFTNVPLEPTLDFLLRKLPSINPSFPVPVACLIDLIRLSASNSFFTFNGDFYEQVFGFSMGNPLSPVLANFFLEHVESELIPSFPGSKPFFFVRYVDDILAAVDAKFDLNPFLTFLNSFYPSLNFTFEWETNSCMPFLDVLIIRSQTHLTFKVFRKSTHSNNYLHFFSFHPVSVKLSVARGLFLRAFRICSSVYLDEEIRFIFKSLSKLGYPNHFLNKALSLAKSSFYRPKPVFHKYKSNICVPYVPTLDSCAISKLASVLDCKIHFNYPNKIKSFLVSNSSPSLTSSGVYRIDCRDCDKFYIGETGRSLSTRLNEHKLAIKNHNTNNALYVHSFEEDHKFNLSDAHLIYKSNDIHTRKVVEASLIKTNLSSIINLNQGLLNIDSFLAPMIVRSVGIGSSGTHHLYSNSADVD
jgi:hypothetical protein